MQAFEPGRLYEARWGNYRMVASFQDGRRCSGALFAVHDNKTQTMALMCARTDAAGVIKQFVAYLEGHGLGAVVDGEKRNLEDFLVFEKLL
jgi:hypothetical protein